MCLKKIIFILLTFTLVINKGLFAQEKVNFREKIEIKESQVQIKTKGSYTIRYVDPVTLKKGYNYLNLPSGDIIYIEYGSGKIKSLYLTSKTGMLKDRIIITGGATQFQCSRGICTCIGEDDCNDMFTTNACGKVAICIGDICACTR